MRKIKRIIVHCTAGSQSNTAADIVSYHTRPKSRGGMGWKNPGYHYIIEASGKIVATHPEERVSNGCKGYNATSINVCYIGGIDPATGQPLDNRTPEQKSSLRSLLRILRQRYPGAEILGHRDLAAKACPSFDARKEYEGI